MRSFEGFRKSGTFIVGTGTEIQGDLILNGAKTTLDLYAKEVFSTHDIQDGCMLGALHDRTKVSLIDCITTQGPGSGLGGDGRYHFSSVFPHVVIFGAIGTVSAEHRPSYAAPGPRGIKVDNKIHVSLSFEDGATINEAITGVHTLLRFLEIIAGRLQTVLSLVFVIPGRKDKPTILDVYWSMSPSRDSDDTEREPHPADLPIQAARTPEHFASVLTRWLDRDHEWRSARARFSTAFALQHSFTIDRLVGAANMFDIMPASAVPVDVPLTKEQEVAKTASRSLFKALPPSPERDSVLNALGRLGKASLKHKVRARAKLIRDRIPVAFPEVELIIDEAVDCRNYFVHGSKAKMDYTEEFDQVIFFIEALEFIFAVSDLVECGWNIEAWSKQSSTLSHPFDRFRLHYELRLKNLKRALAAASLTA